MRAAQQAPILYRSAEPANETLSSLNATIKVMPLLSPVTSHDSSAGSLSQDHFKSVIQHMIQHGIKVQADDGRLLFMAQSDVNLCGLELLLCLHSIFCLAAVNG